ncbi:MAG: glutamine--fructose-6-phosphate transaminase (isomerizing) [Leptotrichiaceae bacterium]|jgi:glucosamine--fructose-6-phosphate aminotransferase (isomerizing)|nr:glutamine--fructose-6-phosphate transaminase (isomerizing) [Leptotrichiaceae bacterium]MBP6167420.1 glutamine--fructose-6-phosphate transaminase (isomerizing) [Leptotrichiaceae bacterium]MBP7026048.1 glutamine--fructose-6-phosphate transaminase (isomerizing) [Leptotrichiaceae bacterium]MBP8636654.1 glutamine--fructose-6-phosphate transaminase (isomerizing) [Leptotrichiaceae bacterium]MBP9538541.1 glutamine--fructose-6-phosphate transaminase (isomerizing) [Leptotrichiaceae bacterium]
MCGIVGYIGSQRAQDFVVDGLEKLEYRGYDSAGIAVNTGGKAFAVVKKQGRLKNLADALEASPLEGLAAIGHTRWATHGKPSDENSHPHFNADKTIVVVHNGIIENYLELKTELLTKGYHFTSETDTEVVAHLLDSVYEGDILEATKKVLKRIRGAYALGIMAVNEPDRIIAVRKESPLIIGLGKGENFIASDIPAILKYTRDVYLIENNEIVELKKDSVKIMDIQGNVINRDVMHVEWDIEAASKGGYEFFMLKEIYEQPEVIEKTLNSRVDADKNIKFDDAGLTKEYLEGINKIYIVACGTAYNAGLIGKFILEKKTRINVELDVASEFRYRNPIVDDKTLVIVLSQSGETLDTLEGLKEAKRNGAKVLAITNVVGSSIAREADNVVYTWAGPEIAVASTKAYTTQMVILYLIAIDMAYKFGKMTREEYVQDIDDLYALRPLVEKMLTYNKQIKEIANVVKISHSMFYLGRGLDFLIAVEGALKSKEISYIHSEAFASGELKHGTIALIEEGVPVIINLTQESLIEKSISNIKEVAARGAYIIAVATEGTPMIDEAANEVFYIPKVKDENTGFLTIIIHQLMAYYLSALKGLDVDKPRNLAKSVTVE